MTIVALLLVAVFGAVYLFSSFRENPITAGKIISDLEENSPAIEVNINNVIEITSSGFSPSTLTISKGDTVTFINKDTEEHWPASATHPIHTDYRGGSYDEPGSYQGSLACRSEGVTKTGAFDACHGLAAGESWSFTFNEVGSWKYHDHIKLESFGTIIVQ